MLYVTSKIESPVTYIAVIHITDVEGVPGNSYTRTYTTQGEAAAYIDGFKTALINNSLSDVIIRS